MRKSFLLYATILSLAVMIACKGQNAALPDTDSMAVCKGGNATLAGNDSTPAFEEAQVIGIALFRAEDLPDSIEAKAKAAHLPVLIDWDSDGKAWITADCNGSQNIMEFLVTDNIEYIDNIAQIIFNDERWLCITYTEDVTGQYWQWMTPESECGVFYKTDLISPQAEPYKMASHGVTIHDGDSSYDAIVVRYLESGTLDTIRYTQVKD